MGEETLEKLLSDLDAWLQDPPTPMSNFNQRREQAKTNFFRQLGSLTEDVTWYIKRVGPVRDSKKRLVPQGIYADKVMRGAVNTIKIKQLLGGGEYMVTLDDPSAMDAEWYGPIEIMGDPFVDVELEADPQIAAAIPEPSDDEDPNEWIKVHDPQRGIIMRQRKDIEAEQRRPAAPDQSVLDLIRKQDENMKTYQDEQRKRDDERREADRRFMQTIAETLAGPKNSDKPDPMVQFIELERARLHAQTEQQKEDLKEARLREQQIRLDADAARRHELEMAEKKFDAEKKRLDEEKKRLDDDRKESV